MQRAIPILDIYEDLLIKLIIIVLIVEGRLYINFNYIVLYLEVGCYILFLIVHRWCFLFDGVLNFFKVRKPARYLKNTSIIVPVCLVIFIYNIIVE